MGDLNYSPEARRFLMENKAKMRDVNRWIANGAVGVKKVTSNDGEDVFIYGHGFSLPEYSPHSTKESFLGKIKRIIWYW